MLIRRLFLLGVLVFVLTLSILGFFFLDVDLPAQWHSLKLATLRKLKLGSPDDGFHIQPVGTPIVHGDDLSDFTLEDGDDGTAIPSFVQINEPPTEIDSSNRVALSKLFETTIPHNTAIQGFTVFDNLVMHNGTFYIITDDPTAFPPRDQIVSLPPSQIQGDYAQIPDPEKDIQFLPPDELEPLLGDSAMRIGGFSWINYDVPMFMDHYYHWWGEIILGGWRTYSLLGLDQDGTFHPERLKVPDRFLHPLISDGKWRDRAGVNGPLMRAAFPHAAIEERDQWLDLIKLNVTIVFERALIVNRWAAHTHPFGNRWSKMIAGAQELKVAEFDPSSSSPSHQGFWSHPRKTLTRNLLGYLPEFASLTDRRILSPISAKSDKPVVTYIVRQKTGRRLTEESHQSLVDALSELEKEGVCKVEIALMENMSLWEQIKVAARSAIMVGVHGNGLTPLDSAVGSATSPGQAQLDESRSLRDSSRSGLWSHTNYHYLTVPFVPGTYRYYDEYQTHDRSPTQHQLWMPPSARSAVMEIVYPQSYIFDYEMLARNVGHKHYMVWNDTLITYAKGTYHQGVQMPEGFHSSNIIVHGPAVAKKIKERLLGTEGDDTEKPEV